MHRFRVGSGTRGTTLVEILVVMVVMLIGIFTVIQLFPTGFRVVRAAESQTIATRLAQQELERWKNMASNLPAGIVPVDEDGNILNGQEPGPPFGAYAYDANGDLKVFNGVYERGNALNYRQVISESTLIPMGSHFNTGMGALYGSRYTVAFSPIDAKRDGNNVLVTPTIKSGDLRRRQGDSGFDPPYLRAGEYAIDYEVSESQISGESYYVFHVAFPRDPGVARRIYYVSFSYWYDDDGNPDTEPQLLSRVDEKVLRNGELLTGDDTDWVEVPIRKVDTTKNESVEMEEATDTCARGFVEQPGGFGSDPYEFKLADPIVGVLAFNPVGQGKYEYTARGIRPIEARINYVIHDPRIIREDRVVPAPKAGAAEVPVKLALRFILNTGDPTDDLKPSGGKPDEQTYEGLIPGQVPLPVLVIDITSGWRVDLPAGAIDFAAGIVRLPASVSLVDYSGDPQGSVPAAGRHLRFFYRVDGDWTVQCHKAYAAYARDYTSGDLDYRSYRIRVDTSSPSRLSNRLLFAACEGLKTVVVDYPYIAPDGVEHKVVGEAHKIDKDPVTGQWCADLKVPPGAYIPRYGRVVVVGTSFTARVLWRDGKKWRYVSMDTQLVKN